MTMEHIQIAYDLCVILIGFAALSISVFWTLKTGQADLRNFCILYTLYTLVLIVLVLKKYLLLNVETYSAWSWYYISGINQFFSFAVIVATIHYFLGVYQIRSGKTLILIFLLLMLISDGLIFSPFGAVLDADKNIIQLGIGFQIASGLYFASFTIALSLGYGLLRRVWKTDRQSFIVGLLIFATVGYGETLVNLLEMLRNPVVILTSESDFLFSSIPYALYGIFILVYFLRYSHPISKELEMLSEDFLAKYGITGRECEIILKVAQGKSNADIASELFVSIATVKTHLHNIYKKIGVASRYSLLARVRSDQ